MVMTTEGIHTPSPGLFFCAACVFLFTVLYVCIEGAKGN